MEAKHWDEAGILGRGLLRISRSVLAAARGSIGERDDMIPSQELARGKEAVVRPTQREQQLRNAEASGAT